MCVCVCVCVRACACACVCVCVCVCEAEGFQVSSQEMNTGVLWHIQSVISINICVEGSGVSLCGPSDCSSIYNNI